MRLLGLPQWCRHNINTAKQMIQQQSYVTYTSYANLIISSPIRGRTLYKKHIETHKNNKDILQRIKGDEPNTVRKQRKNLHKSWGWTRSLVQWISSWHTSQLELESLSYGERKATVHCWSAPQRGTFSSFPAI